MRTLDWSNLAARIEPRLRIDAHPEWVVAEYRKQYPAWTPTEIFYAATTAGRSWRGQVIEAEPILDYLAFRRAWLRERGLNPARCALIAVRGDSMAPTLHPGDVVLLDLTDLYIRSDGLYALRLDGGLLVKRVQRLAEGVIEVISDNTAYRRFTLPEAWQGPTQQVVGRVVWAGVRF